MLCTVKLWYTCRGGHAVLRQMSAYDGGFAWENWMGLNGFFFVPVADESGAFGSGWALLASG
jgi:hypothetical protein